MYVSGQTGLNPSPVIAGDKKVTVTSHVDFCVANAHSVTGLPQNKGINPNYCYKYTEIKYVKDVSCVGHLSSANLVTNAPPVVISPPVGARLHNFWEKWEVLGSSPKVVTTLREGYTLPFRFRPNLPRSPTVISNYQHPSKQAHLLQKCSRTGSKPKLTRVLQPAIFGTQTQHPLETGPGPEPLEHLSKHRLVQNGDPRDNKDLPTVGGVGHIHRLQRRILPYSNSQSVQEVHAFSHPGPVLPVQSPTLWPVHSTHGVHNGGQRGQTDGFTEGTRIHQYLDDWLVRATSHQTCLQHTQTLVALSRTRLAGEQGEVRTGSKTGVQFCRLPVRPQGGQGQTHTRALADLNRQDIVNPVWSGVPGPAVHVPHRTSHSHRKASPLRSTSHETHTVALE